jgi:CSLREA domain-containing protein
MKARGINSSDHFSYALISFKSIRIILTACIAMGVFLASMMPARAAELITVDTADDNLTDDGLCTLREAITAANTNAPVNGTDDCDHDGSGGPDGISFAGNYTITLSSALPNITEDLTIFGNGTANTILQANASFGVATYRVLTIDGATVELHLLTIRHGGCVNTCAIDTVRGGGILSRNSSLTLNTVTVSGNTAWGAGGIYNNGGSLTIQNGSLISSNSSTNSVLSGSAGGVSFGGSTLLVDDSTISNNSGDGNGGGIELMSVSGSATIQNGSSISHNSAVGGGGGVFNPTTTHLTITNSTIAYNESELFAGGIYGKATISGTYLVGNHSSGDGGAIVTSATGANILNITGSYILFNNAGGSGGGVNVSPSMVNAVSVTGNCILGNGGIAFYNGTSFSQNATGNWWGAADGPGPVGPSAFGDRVSTNVDYSGFLTAPLAGCSTNPAPAVSFDDSSLSFGSQVVGTSSGTPTIVTLTNTGSRSLHITTLDLNGADFGLTGDNCSGQIVTPGNSCTFNVTFLPVASGVRTGNVQVNSDAPTSPDVVSLHGTGLLTLTPPTLKAPANGSAVTKAPKLIWTGLKGASGFHVEIDDDSDFSSPEQTADVLKSPYSAASLPFGRYYWHVATRGLSSLGAYSSTFTFDVTLLKSPKLNTSIKANKRITLSWNGDKTGQATQYEVCYDTDADPSDGTCQTVTGTKLKLTTLLTPGDWYWTITIVNGTNAGQVMPVWHFTVIP